jgi:hypothetical protein
MEFNLDTGLRFTSTKFLYDLSIQQLIERVYKEIHSHSDRFVICEV